MCNALLAAMLSNIRQYFRRHPESEYYRECVPNHQMELIQ